MISPLFTTIVLVAGFIWVYMKMSSRNPDKNIEDFLEKERLSNSVRKQPLDNLDYINVNIDDFVIPEAAMNERVNDLYDSIKLLSKSKIVNFTGVTNTELKLTYGVANLNTLTEYDQNFTTLCRSTYDLAIELNNQGFKSEAEAILSKGIEYGTDISGNYLMLADLYIERGSAASILNLIKSADNIRSLTKESTIEKLKEKLSSNNGVLVNDDDGSVSYQNPGNILPEDILDILETVPYKSDDQKQ